MKTTMLQEPISWRADHTFLQSAIPINIRQWLTDKGSLTERLIKRYAPYNIEVKVLEQTTTLTNLDQAKILNIRNGTRIKIREVNLMCQTKPLVYARSLIPETSMKGRLRRLKSQGQQSLGATLFSDPSMRRGKLELTKTLSQHLPNVKLPKNTAIWGRRRIFHVSNHPILVAEFFLPNLFSNQ